MSPAQVAQAVADALEEDDLAAVAGILAPLAAWEVGEVLDRLGHVERGVTFRLLDKPRALEVFESADTGGRADLLDLLGEEEVAGAFEQLGPDDRVALLDELPATVARRLVQRLSGPERDVTAVVLGYPQGSVGRRMSPDAVHVLATQTAGEALARLRAEGAASETIYTVPVLGERRDVVGVVGLRELFLGDPGTPVSAHMGPALVAHAEDAAEPAARRCLARRLLAMPVVDRESRLVGLLTVDDAVRIVDAADEEDAARAGATEPLRRPYLRTSVVALTRARIVWLSVLAVSALLTVNVLELFEATLEQQVTLALFIPLLTGIGGNTGSQASTTVTRALATGEARPSDALRVAAKEARTGLLLGSGLAVVGGLAAALVYDASLGLVIALTIVSICTLAATVGGTVPLLARAAGVDPAVFSTPFITTFCDATGLLIYFSIAVAVLGL